MYGQGSYQDYDDGLDYEVQQGMNQYLETDDYGDNSGLAASDWFDSEGGHGLGAGVRSGQAIDIVVGPVRDRLRYGEYDDGALDDLQADYSEESFESYDDREDLYNDFESYQEDDTQDDARVQKIALSEPVEPPVIKHFNQDSAQQVASNNAEPDSAPRGGVVSTKNIFRRRTNRLGREIEQPKSESNIQIKSTANDAPKGKVKVALPVKFSGNTVQLKEVITEPLVADNTQNSKIVEEKEPGEHLKSSTNPQVDEPTPEAPVLTNYQEDNGEEVVETNLDSKDDLLVEFKSELEPNEEIMRHNAEEDSHDVLSTFLTRDDNSENAKETVYGSKQNEHQLSQSLQPSLRSEVILANNLLNADSPTDSAGPQSKTASLGGVADEDAEIMAMFDTDSYISPIKLRKSKAKARISLIVIFILLAVIIAGGIYLYTVIMPNI